MSKKSNARLQLEVTRRVAAETHAGLLEEALAATRATAAAPAPAPAPPPPAPAAPPAATKRQEYLQLKANNPYLAAQWLDWYPEIIEEAQAARTGGQS